MASFRHSLVLFACVLSVGMPFGVARAAGNESIVAIVNKGVVTASDVKARMLLIQASGGLKPSKELDAKLRPQIVDMLIDEQLRTQEAQRLGLTVDAKEIDAGFEGIARQNNVPADIFKKAMEVRGINLNTMRDQIKAQLSWTKVVQKRIRPRIEVSDADIDTELDRLKQDIGKDQYNVEEIYLPVPDVSKQESVKSFAGKLAEQLKKEPEAFEKAARQFSQSPGASQGRFVGWILAGVLPKEVDDILPTMGKGGISSAIETPAGYYILKLADKRQLSEADLPSRDDILERIGMQRLDKAQRRYYTDLRSQAFIEKRG